jgi:hypothetical protein
MPCAGARLTAPGLSGIPPALGARWSLARDNPEAISSTVGFGAPVKTGPAIVLMLIALLTLDNR